MAYFLKQTRNRKGLYLQIYESHWDPERRHTANRSVKALGYEDELKTEGIADSHLTFQGRGGPHECRAEGRHGEGEGAGDI